MMKRFLTVLLLLLQLSAIGQEERTVAFYNVENLFDTIDGINDDAEFLPGSEKEWNSEKYFAKLDKLASGLKKLDPSPLLVGLCEVENQLVVRDLMARTFPEGNYSLVHYESPDARGIDVSLIYDSSSLLLINSGTIQYILPGNDRPTSRDILWAKFLIGKDTLIAMVNHWPSRRGGQQESEPNRICAAKAALNFIDSVTNLNERTRIIFMGDLNDHPENSAPGMISTRLTPMISPASGDFGGTYNYNGEWDVLDHIFVSASMQRRKGFRVLKDSGKIWSDKELLSNYKGQLVPLRTFAGSKYLGGYSDHLPVSVKVCIP